MAEQTPERTPRQAEPRRQRFTRAMHVRQANDFQRAYKQGSRARGAMMTVAAVPNGLGLTRLGLSIGKRVWKQAVARNRVRRIFREAFRLSYGELPPGMDLILIGSCPKVRPRLDEAREELEQLARKAARRHAERAGREEAP